MKNMKFKIVSATIVFLLVLTGVSFCSGSKAGNIVLASGLSQQQIIQYKEDILAKKQIVIQNYQTNVALGKEISEKRTTIKNLVAKIKDSQKQLTADDVSNMKALAQTINKDVSSLTSTNSAISDDFITVVKDIGTRSFEKIKTDLDNIAAIQNERTQALKKLNADMDTMIKSLQTAMTNAKIS
jgi:septal ring factor EnvC (AmiA/AmiB activator)